VGKALRFERRQFPGVPSAFRCFLTAEQAKKLRETGNRPSCEQIAKTPVKQDETADEDLANAGETDDA
jgi:hypothetical protein